MLGIWVGKLVLVGLRILGKQATSLPGKLALKVQPKLIARLGRQLHRSVIVTGTNGKTTTANLLAAMLRQDEPIIHNAEGANLPQGIATTLLRHTNWFGRLTRRVALFEIDEATLPLVARHLPIRVAVVTNIFRDQLDRYGEIDVTLAKLKDGLRLASDEQLILNGDDPLARAIGLSLGEKQALYYGLDPAETRTDVRQQVRDGAFCLSCGSPLAYNGFFYGQLGVYHCTACDFARPHLDFMGQQDAPSGLQVTQGALPQLHVRVPVRGIFNIYNALAAIAAARTMGLTGDQVQRGLDSFETPTGRMQVFPTHPESILNLVKNPTGCDSVLQSICNDTRNKVVCIGINDLAADGRDVSWLWDADFELLSEHSYVSTCVVTGLRAEDMAIRLKYAGYATNQLVVEPDLDKALGISLEKARNAGQLPLYVITTYTLLHETARRLSERSGHTETVAHRASVS